MISSWHKNQFADILKGGTLRLTRLGKFRLLGLFRWTASYCHVRGQRNQHLCIWVCYLEAYQKLILYFVHFIQVENSEMLDFYCRALFLKWIQPLTVNTVFVRKSQSDPWVFERLFFGSSVGLLDHPLPHRSGRRPSSSEIEQIRKILIGIRVWHHLTIWLISFLRCSRILVL